MAAFIGLALEEYSARIHTVYKVATITRSSAFPAGLVVGAGTALQTLSSFAIDGWYLTMHHFSCCYALGSYVLRACSALSC